MSPAVIALLGVVVGALLTALLNFFLQRAADGRRWEREDAAQRERWEREDRVRFQAERLGVYRDFLMEARRTLDTGGEAFDEDRMAPLLREIELIGSDEVAVTATDVFMHASQAHHADRRFRQRRESGEKAEEAMLRFEESHRWFLRASRAELGIPEDLPEQ